MKGGLAMKKRNINLKEMAHTLGRVLRYMSVSYTHLDVYKRQGLPFPPGNASKG